MLHQLPPTLPNLLREFAREARTFIREEIQLAKTEMTEKFSEWAEIVAWIGIGAVAAYGGLIVLLIALSLLTALGFQHLEMDQSLAMSAGFSVVGLLAIIIGTISLLSAIKAFSRRSLSPERAIANIYKVRGEPVPIHHKPAREKKEKNPRSHDLERTVIDTEDRLGRIFEELERRLTFGGMRRRLYEQVQLHPYRYGFWALFGGFAASLFVVRRVRI